MLEHWCGLRVGDVAATRIAGIVDEQRTVKAEIVLAAAVTKSKRARRIFVPKTMQQQLKRYVGGICYGVAQRPCARVESVTVLGKQASSFIW